MFITENLQERANISFDWSTYFNSSSDKKLSGLDINECFLKIREHLTENNVKMTFTLSRFMRILLEKQQIKNPRVLELGAATGFLTRWILNQYEGKGFLVDNNSKSYDAYKNTSNNLNGSIEYIISDVFKFDLDERFDIVCSFGLIEHFADKKELLKIHQRYLNKDGIAIIIVPMDTPLSRTFWEVHPEQNLGYRELLTKSDLINELKSAGLQVISSAVSEGYVYDFVGAVCK